MCQAIYLFIVSTAWELCVVVYHVVLTSHYNRKNCFNIFFCPPHICNRRLFVTPAHLKSKWFCCLYINVALRTPSFLFSLYFVCVSLAAIRNFAWLDKYEHVIRRPINCPSTWGFYLSSTSNLRIYDEFVVFFCSLLNRLQPLNWPGIVYSSCTPCWSASSHLLPGKNSVGVLFFFAELTYYSELHALTDAAADSDMKWN